MLSRDYHDAQVIGNAFRITECQYEDVRLQSGMLYISNTV